MVGFLPRGITIEEMGLDWIEAFSNYALWLVMPYLTSVWGLSLTDATVIVNFYHGATKIMPMAMLFFSDSLLGHYRTIVISNLSSVLGLGFLVLSTPPMLAAFSRSCSEYGPKCITEKHRILFYIGLALSGIAISGYKTSKETIQKQRESQEAAAYGGGGSREWLGVSLSIIPLVGVIAMGYVSWTIATAIAFSCTVLATVIFFLSPSRYNHPQRLGNPINSKARMAHAISVLSLCLTLITCGIVSSIGDSYFVQQAKHLTSKLGFIPIPLTFVKSSNDRFSKVGSRIFSSLLGSARYGPPVGVGASMVLCILCCVVASSLEAKRLAVVMSHGLIDQPDATVPMNILWTLPQYMLLGAMHGMFKTSVECFIKRQVPDKVKRYVGYCTNAVFGLGIMGNALSVHLTEIVTGKDGKTGWFGETLNESRVDKYYWLLALMSAGPLVLFVPLACCLKYEVPRPENEEYEGGRRGYMSNRGKLFPELAQRLLGGPSDEQQPSSQSEEEEEKEEDSEAKDERRRY